MNNEINIFTYPSLKSNLLEFFKTYSSVSLEFSPNEKIKSVPPLKTRECRFCNNKFPKVKFKKKRHI